MIRLKIMGMAIGGVVLAYGSFWHYMAGEVQDRIEEMVVQQKNKGVSIQYEDLDITGFPYRMELAIDKLQIIKTGENQSEVSMAIPKVTLVAFPWKINEGVIVSDSGALRVGGRRNPEFTAVFGATRASLLVDLGSRRLEQASFVLNDVAWAVGKLPEQGPRSQAREVKLHILLPREENGGSGIELPLQAKLYLEAADVEAQEVPTGIFGKKANLIKVDMALHGAQMPRYDYASLTGWRDAGGTLAVKTFEITSGVMDLLLSGESSLDQNMMPLGAFSARIHGVDHIANVLSHHTAFQQEPGSQILEELHRMSVIEDQGPYKGQNALDLSISLQNGMLFLGPIPVGELAPVIAPQS